MGRYDSLKQWEVEREERKEGQEEEYGKRVWRAHCEMKDRLLEKSGACTQEWKNLH